MGDQDFRKLLDELGYSWKGYRRVRKGVKKRLSRFLEKLAMGTVDELLAAIKGDSGLRQEVENLLTVSLSRFFRDREVWGVLEEEILPGIVRANPGQVAVWSAGCARGEEPYSFKILWAELRKKTGRIPDLDLWATDRNPLYLHRAWEGIYEASSLQEVPAQWRDAYFRAADAGRLGVVDFLKEGIRWKVHNLLLDDPPSKEFQLIFLRNNLLTYYQGELQKPALRQILTHLAPGGFLLTGSHEKLPAEFQTLRQFGHPNIFRRL